MAARGMGHNKDGVYIPINFHWHIYDGTTVLLHTDSEKLARQKFAFFQASSLPGEKLRMEPPRAERPAHYGDKAKAERQRHEHYITFLTRS